MILHRADMHAAFEVANEAAWPGLPPCVTGDEATRRTIAALNALDDAGLLVTPQMLAVVEAARIWCEGVDKVSATQAEARHNANLRTANREALQSAVDAYEAQRCARCGTVDRPAPHGPAGMRVCDPCLAEVDAGGEGSGA